METEMEMDLEMEADLVGLERAIVSMDLLETVWLKEMPKLLEEMDHLISSMDGTICILIKTKEMDISCPTVCG